MEMADDWDIGKKEPGQSAMVADLSRLSILSNSVSTAGIMADAAVCFFSLP